MLDDIGRISKHETKNQVAVGITKKSQILKAANHDLGDTLPTREFFGVTEKRAKELAEQVPRRNQLNLLDAIESATATTTTTTTLENLLDETDFNFIEGEPF